MVSRSFQQNSGDLSRLTLDLARYARMLSVYASISALLEKLLPAFLLSFISCFLKFGKGLARLIAKRGVRSLVMAIGRGVSEQTLKRFQHGQYGQQQVDDGV